MSQPTRTSEYVEQQLPVWRQAGLVTAVIVVGMAIAAPTVAAARLGLLATAFAVLSLAPNGERSTPRLLRWGGMACAVATLLLGLAHWWHRGGVAAAIHLPGATAVCFVVLGFSLLAKPRLPRMAVTADMLAALVGYALLLDYLLGAPTVRHPAPGAAPQPTWLVAAGLLLISGAWMTVWPRHRPVAFFVESGSAGVIMRKLLPITLLYPALLVAAAALRGHAWMRAAAVATAVVVYGTVLFGVALFWVIAHVLDRRDAQSRSAGEQIRASEHRYRQLFERDPSAALIFDAASLRILEINESALARFGYSREEFLAMSVPEIWPAGPNVALADHAAEIRAANGLIRRHRAKNGRWLEVEVYSHAVEWHGSDARLAFMHDVTDRMSAEQKLRDSDEQVRTLLESTTEGIYAVNAAGECVWCNPAAVRILHAGSVDALLGQTIHALVHHTRADGSPYPASECTMMLAARRGEALEVEEELVWRLDGTSFPADFRSSPLWRDGQMTGAVVSFVDVTDRRTLRAQFEQAQKMEAVGRLAAGVAHDFNNLLTVINGYTDMLMAQGVPPQNRAKVTSIRSAGERAAGLTKQLLAFSRQQVLEPKILDLNGVLAEMDPLLRRVIGEDLVLTTLPGPGIGNVRADPGQVSQVLMNLVVNARDAMPRGGRITVETANVSLDEHYCAQHPGVIPGEYVVLAVTDTGIGMDESTRKHLFEPFFTTKPAGKGTGLGLATVFGIIKQSGGSVGVYSELGHGTSMKVYLPRVTGVVAGEALVPAPPSAAKGCETILLVEDEETVRSLMAEILQGNGYRVLVADRPQQGIEIARNYSDKLDMLISDVVMPEMDGRRLMHKVLELQPQVAVLFVSGYPDRAIAEHGELEPGLAFLQKPFTPAALARKVRETLDAGPAAKRLAAAG